jgi:hypothetical protein
MSTFPDWPLPADMVEAVDEIVVFGESQVGKTCFIDMVGYLLLYCQSCKRSYYYFVFFFLQYSEVCLFAFACAYGRNLAYQGPPFRGIPWHS